jgi:hypothetical protein
MQNLSFPFISVGSYSSLKYFELDGWELVVFYI